MRLQRRVAVGVREALERAVFVTKDGPVTVLEVVVAVTTQFHQGKTHGAVIRRRCIRRRSGAVEAVLRPRSALLLARASEVQSAYERGYRAITVRRAARLVPCFRTTIDAVVEAGLAERFSPRAGD
ncbi:MAG: hypothetical protein JWO62_3327 [Acidimicrobiaceae bacterium]|nr:hypothetical protein [Acidimicrobiaceae bacterium]